MYYGPMALFNLLLLLLSPNNNAQQCVEVHAVIGQHIIECMDSNEAMNLSPVGGNFDTVYTVNEELLFSLQKSYGVHDPVSLPAIDYLKYRRNEIEKYLLPDNVKSINMFILVDPYNAIYVLQNSK